MVEVLVSLAVLSIGLLGTAALQMQAKRSNLGSIERTTASMLANDLFERMRANPSMFATYRDALDSTQSTGFAGSIEPAPDCESSSCSPFELAEHDVWEWEQALIGAAEESEGENTGGLVLPMACLTGPTDGGSGTYTIAINWRGHDEIDTSTPDPCGADASGRYDGDLGTGSLRRTIVMSGYLNAN
jgi:type IV pilus assembly protein PilV